LNFEFLIRLKIYTKCLAIALPFLIQLQSININYIKAIDIIDTIKFAFNTIRDDLLNELKIICNQTKMVAENMDVEIWIRKTTNIRHQKNTNHIINYINDLSEYYRINIFSFI